MFMDTPYIVSVRAIDGLGLLKNFKYTTANGILYEGEETIINIFAKCLKPLGLDLNINTYAKISHDGMPVGSDPFAYTKLYQERYLITNKLSTEIGSAHV